MWEGVHVLQWCSYIPVNVLKLHAGNAGLVLNFTKLRSWSYCTMRIRMQSIIWDKRKEKKIMI
jgi:hypothetical protein